jgi:hypothetical protein
MPKLAQHAKLHREAMRSVYDRDQNFHLAGDQKQQDESIQ